MLPDAPGQNVVQRPVATVRSIRLTGEDAESIAIIVDIAAGDPEIDITLARRITDIDKLRETDWVTALIANRRSRVKVITDIRRSNAIQEHG